MIEPGYFKTFVTSPEAISWGLQAAWDQASPEVKELYAETFLASGEGAVDLGERSKPLSGSLGPPLTPPPVSGPSSRL